MSRSSHSPSQLDPVALAVVGEVGHSAASLDLDVLVHRKLPQGPRHQLARAPLAELLYFTEKKMNEMRKKKKKHDCTNHNHNQLFASTCTHRLRTLSVIGEKEKNHKKQFHGQPRFNFERARKLKQDAVADKGKGRRTCHDFLQRKLFPRRGLIRETETTQLRGQ